MTLILSDIPDLNQLQNTDRQVITNDAPIHHCIGCFGCWIKTPGKCVINDSYQNMGTLLSRCDQLIIVSKCTYGGYSPFIKNIFDRSIPYISPYFEMRNGEMHHQRRYDNVINITAYFYGDDITESEKATAQSLVTANAINLDGKVDKVLFYHCADEVKEALSCRSL